MGEAWDEKQVFLRALELSPLERSTYLASACPTPAAKLRIEALLKGHASDHRGLLNSDLKLGDAFAPDASGAFGANSRVQVDEFAFIRELGRGGMGFVYLARDTALGRLAAVKVLAPHLVDSEPAIERFRQEGRAVAALDHPGIVPVYRAACSMGRHYIAMAYIEGETLHERIRAALPQAGDATPTGDLPAVFRDPSLVLDAARIIAAVAEALDHAHRNGVVHRDVKPSNIIVDAEGSPHLTDFGIAKVVGSAALTTPGDLAGTAYYMSPEQAEQSPEAVDHRSDLFSLGIVLYEMLALRRPFDGPNQQRVLEAIRHDEPPDLRDANPIVPVDLATICHKALEKRLQNRYQSAAHMAADLRSFLAGDPILARPPSAVRRVKRWAKRHRASAAAAFIVASFAIAAASVAWVVRSAQSGLCILDLQGNGFQGNAMLRRVSDDGMELGEAQQVGTVPLRTRVPPGIYRLAVVNQDGRFIETTLSLLRSGEPRNLVLDEPTHDRSMVDDMVFVSGGICTTGVAGRDPPQGPRQVRLAPFFIDRREVSNAEYRRFVEATGAALPWPWLQPEFQAAETDDLPVVGITWEQAEAYARWVGKRLPTAAEWECAMRAPDGRLTPWDADDVELPVVELEEVRGSSSSNRNNTLHLYLTHMMPVDARPDLATPSGILHASTNAREWTASIIPGKTQVLIKGASWSDDPRQTDLALMRTFPLETLADDQMAPSWSMMLGFRCARSAAP